MSVQGHATGSNFYPANQGSNNGVALSKYNQVHTVPQRESPSKERSNSKSPRKVHMPVISSAQQKVTLDEILWEDTPNALKRKAGTRTNMFRTQNMGFRNPKTSGDDITPPMNPHTPQASTNLHAPLGVTFNKVNLNTHSNKKYSFKHNSIAH